MIEYAAIVLIIFTSGFIQGLTGFGAGVVAVPLLTLFLDIKEVIPFVALNGLVLLIIMVVRLWRHIDFGKAMPLIIGSLPGLVVGVYILKNFDDAVIKMILAVVLIFYSLYSLLVKEIRMKVNEKFGYLCGFLAGALGGAITTTGPPVVIYATLQGWSGNKFRGILTGFFFVNSLFMIAGHAVAGITTRLTLEYLMVGAPVIALGTFAGAMFYHKVNQEFFTRLVYILLLAMGILMIPR